MKKLFIISNESVLSNENNFFCDNIDLKIISEGLKDKFEVKIIARKSKKERSHQIKLKNIEIYGNIINFLTGLKKNFKSDHDSKYLIISITPFTFLASILLRLFNKRSVVYLRSDGYEEYKSILGFVGPAIYHFMFSIVTRIFPILSCGTRILKGKKGNIVLPSQINNNWLTENNTTQTEKVKLLYVGRLKVEKGIFSFLEILKKDHEKYILSIIGSEKKSVTKINQKNVNVYEIENNEQKLIQIYDKHNIFVLPSFTEGHPMVLLEALSRLRPVIIFPEIEHVVGNKKGIFVAERNYKSFAERVDYIIKNYTHIQSEMKKNDLPTKNKCLQDLGSFIYDI